MVQPVNVWGGHEPAAEEVFEQYEREWTDEDVERKNRKVRPKPGQMVQDLNKHSPKPRKAALYRANGEMTPVPLEMAQWYLKRRDQNGNRIFYADPPMEAPLPTSDPCPASGIDGRICGKRMKNQFELIKHLVKKHADQASFYVNQKQIDAALGRIAYQPNQVIGDDPMTAPSNIADIDTSVVNLKVVEREVEEYEVAKAQENAPIVVEAEEIHPVRIYVPDEDNKRLVTLKHTCESKGRGKYVADCPRCQELIAKRVEAGTMVEGS